MRKLMLAIGVLGLISFTSCSNDDDGPSNLELNSENLVGTYDIYFVEGTETTTATVGGAEVVTVKEIEGDTFTNATLTFNTDGTYTTAGNYVAHYTTFVNGEQVDQQSEIADLEDAGSYSFNNDNYTITMDGEAVDVLYFRNNELRLLDSSSDSETGFVTEYKTEFRMTKQ